MLFFVYPIKGIVKFKALLKVAVLESSRTLLWYFRKFEGLATKSSISLVNFKVKQFSLIRTSSENWFQK
jgi:hypothetical protein